MKKFLSTIFRYLTGRFTSAIAQQNFASVMDLVPHALPVISRVAGIAASLTPTELDDQVLLIIRTKYPKYFDGSLKPDEMKLYLLGLATELLRSRFPAVSVSVARAAVQLAYVGQQSEASPSVVVSVNQ